MKDFHVVYHGRARNGHKMVIYSYLRNRHYNFTMVLTSLFWPFILIFTVDYLFLFLCSAFSLIPPVTIRRLMAAVSFGYGLFHLAVSLLPQKLSNVTHFLGFEGDQQTEIQALYFARQGNDMRGPLAT